MSALTVKETARLTELEAVIEKGVNTFIEVGDALLIIREEKLYRNEHETFEVYCRVRWQFGRARANQLIEAAQITHVITESPGGTMATNGSHSETPAVGNATPVPATERQVRALAKLPESERAEAWQEVVEAAGDAKVTAKNLADVVNRRLGPTPEILCPSCQRALRVGKPVVDACADCKALRKASKKRQEPPSREPGDDPDEIPSEPIVDAEGEKVPSQALLAFERAKRFSEICREIDKLIREVEELSKGPGGRLIRFDSFRQQMKDAKGNLWGNRATHVCPYCHGKPRKTECECCKGEGWVAKHLWAAAPGNDLKAK